MNNTLTQRERHIAAVIQTAGKVVTDKSANLLKSQAIWPSIKG